MAWLTVRLTYTCLARPLEEQNHSPLWPLNTHSFDLQCHLSHHLSFLAPAPLPTPSLKRAHPHQVPSLVAEHNPFTVAQLQGRPTGGQALHKGWRR